MQGKELDFFLGALSPSGFCSYYLQAIPSEQTQTAVLLKAGPGCGKSTLLKRAAEKLLSQGETVEHIHCAGDPDSFDGVICQERNLALLDATAPHALEPHYPGAFEDVISLYSHVDRAQLRIHREEIIALHRQYNHQTERAVRYITAAGSLLQDSMRVAMCCTDLAKTRRFAETLSKRYLPSTKGQGSETIRLLSAITSQGHVFYADTIQKLADTIIVLDDEYGAVGRTLMQTLRQQALSKGHRIITCYCSICPYEKIEHLLLPEIGVAFVTSNHYHPVQFENQRTIHYTRFTEKEGLKLRRKRLRFNKKATSELLEQATDMLQQGNQTHAELETYYKAALNFEALEATYQDIDCLL